MANKTRWSLKRPQPVYDTWQISADELSTLLRTGELTVIGPGHYECRAGDVVGLHCPSDNGIGVRLRCRVVGQRCYGLEDRLFYWDLKALPEDLIGSCSVANYKSPLEHIGYVSGGKVKKFVVGEHFKKGQPNPVAIWQINDNFERHFLGKVERNVEPSSINNVFNLKEPLLDLAILVEIIAGHKHDYEAKLAHVWGLLCKQPNGEDTGQLVTNGRENILFVSDHIEALWMLSLSWHRDERGWRIFAGQIGHPTFLRAGSRVFTT